MTLRFRPAAADDLYAIVNLLRARDLPTDGIGPVVREHPEAVIVAELNAVVVGVAALDIHGTHALLRSVVVARDLATLGVGSTLVTEAIALARTRELSSLSLLTATAQQWFPRFGFVEAPRAEAPESLRSHPEFTSTCGASAMYMTLTL